MACPEPLCPRPHARTPVWLVTTDDQCTRATEQAQLQTECVIVQVGAGQPKPRGLPRGTALLVVTEVPHDPHMVVHPYVLIWIRYFTQWFLPGLTRLNSEGVRLNH